MFTGIIEEIGKVVSIKKGAVSSQITFSAEKILGDVNDGDSIAVNGVCLTATHVTPGIFTADIMAETIRRSNLGKLKSGNSVNMERAMLCGGRFGGHIVSGHIDGCGSIIDLKREENAVWVTVMADQNIMKYIIQKGSVALDGISLTVASVMKDQFRVSVIPHTGEETTLLSKSKGDIINIECDMIGKYVEKLLGYNQELLQKSSITGDFLASHGFI